MYGSIVVTKNTRSEKFKVRRELWRNIVQAQYIIQS